MKKQVVFFNIVYYILIPAVFFGLLGLTSALSGGKYDLGSVFTFFVTPAMMFILMRLSLLRFYVDPFAAAEIPICFYLSMIINNMRTSGSFGRAFKYVNGNLTDDGGSGIIFLIALFVLGLIFSFSKKRKSGKSISYRLIEKLSNDRTSKE